MSIESNLAGLGGGSSYEIKAPNINLTMGNLGSLTAPKLELPELKFGLSGFDTAVWDNLNKAIDMAALNPVISKTIEELWETRNDGRSQVWENLGALARMGTPGYKVDLYKGFGIADALDNTLANLNKIAKGGLPNDLMIAVERVVMDAGAMGTDRLMELLTASANADQKQLLALTEKAQRITADAGSVIKNTDAYDELQKQVATTKNALTTLVNTAQKQGLMNNKQKILSVNEIKNQSVNVIQGLGTLNERAKVDAANKAEMIKTLAVTQLAGNQWKEGIQYKLTDIAARKGLLAAAMKQGAITQDDLNKGYVSTQKLMPVYMEYLKAQGMDPTGKTMMPSFRDKTIETAINAPNERIVDTLGNLAKLSGDGKSPEIPEPGIRNLEFNTLGATGDYVKGASRPTGWETAVRVYVMKKGEDGKIIEDYTWFKTADAARKYAAPFIADQTNYRTSITGWKLSRNDPNRDEGEPYMYSRDTWAAEWNRGVKPEGTIVEYISTTGGGKIKVYVTPQEQQERKEIRLNSAVSAVSAVQLQQNVKVQNGRMFNADTGKELSVDEALTFLRGNKPQEPDKLTYNPYKTETTVKETPAKKLIYTNLGGDTPDIIENIANEANKWYLGNEDELSDQGYLNRKKETKAIVGPGFNPLKVLGGSTTRDTGLDTAIQELGQYGAYTGETSEIKYTLTKDGMELREKILANKLQGNAQSDFGGLDQAKQNILVYGTDLATSPEQRTKMEQEIASIPNKVLAIDILSSKNNIFSAIANVTGQKDPVQIAEMIRTDKTVMDNSWEVTKGRAGLSVAVASNFINDISSPYMTGEPIPDMIAFFALGGILGETTKVAKLLTRAAGPVKLSTNEFIKATKIAYNIGGTPAATGFVKFVQNGGLIKNVPESTVHGILDGMIPSQLKQVAVVVPGSTVDQFATANVWKAAPERWDLAGLQTREVFTKFNNPEEVAKYLENDVIGKNTKIDTYKEIGVNTGLGPSGTRIGIVESVKVTIEDVKTALEMGRAMNPELADKITETQRLLDNAFAPKLAMTPNVKQIQTKIALKQPTLESFGAEEGLIAKLRSVGITTPEKLMEVADTASLARIAGIKKFDLITLRQRMEGIVTRQTPTITGDESLTTLLTQMQKDNIPLDILDYAKITVGQLIKGDIPEAIKLALEAEGTQLGKVKQMMDYAISVTGKTPNILNSKASDVLRMVHGVKIGQQKINKLELILNAKTKGDYIPQNILTVHEVTAKQLMDGNLPEAVIKRFDETGTSVEKVQEQLKKALEITGTSDRILETNAADVMRILEKGDISDISINAFKSMSDNELGAISEITGINYNELINLKETAWRETGYIDDIDAKLLQLQHALDTATKNGDKARVKAIQQEIDMVQQKQIDADDYLDYFGPEDIRPGELVDEIPEATLATTSDGTILSRYDTIPTSIDDVNAILKKSDRLTVTTAEAMDAGTLQKALSSDPNMVYRMNMQDIEKITDPGKKRMIMDTLNTAAKNLHATTIKELDEMPVGQFEKWIGSHQSTLKGMDANKIAISNIGKQKGAQLINAIGEAGGKELDAITREAWAKKVGKEGEVAPYSTIWVKRADIPESQVFDVKKADEYTTEELKTILKEDPSLVYNADVADLTRLDEAKKLVIRDAMQQSISDLETVTVRKMNDMTPEQLTKWIDEHPKTVESMSQARVRASAFKENVKNELMAAIDAKAGGKATAKGMSDATTVYKNIMQDTAKADPNNFVEAFRYSASQRLDDLAKMSRTERKAAGFSQKQEDIIADLLADKNKLDDINTGLADTDRKIKDIMSKEGKMTDDEMNVFDDLHKQMLDQQEKANALKADCMKKNPTAIYSPCGKGGVSSEFITAATAITAAAAGAATLALTSGNTEAQEWKYVKEENAWSEQQTGDEDETQETIETPFGTVTMSAAKVAYGQVPESVKTAYNVLRDSGVMDFGKSYSMGETHGIQGAGEDEKENACQQYVMKGLEEVKRSGGNAVALQVIGRYTDTGEIMGHALLGLVGKDNKITVVDPQDGGVFATETDLSGTKAYMNGDREYTIESAVAIPDPVQKDGLLVSKSDTITTFTNIDEYIDPWNMKPGATVKEVI